MRFFDDILRVCHSKPLMGYYCAMVPAIRQAFRHYIVCLLLSASGIAVAAESGVVLLYHHVATGTPPSTSISPKDFRAHLDYLRDNNFSVLPLDELVQSLRSRTPLPDRAVAITFDDGYSSIYETAFPLLQEYGMPFALFVSTEPINNRQKNYMTWEQIRALSEAGALIANHMVSHPYMLSRNAEETDANWLARQRAELLEAEATILKETGQSHRFLAYPYGEFNAQIKAMLAEEGYVGFAQNSGAVGYSSDFHALPRYPLAGIYARLETARVKFSTLAFDVELLEPDSPVTELERPEALLRFNLNRISPSQLGCYDNGKAMTLTWENRETGLLRIQAADAHSDRRWRYICTAPSTENGRYFWYSVPWINPR